MLFIKLIYLEVLKIFRDEKSILFLDPSRNPVCYVAETIVHSDVIVEEYFNFTST